jgi:hypothetical protein
MLPTERLKKSDEFRRLADENPTPSLTTDIFSNTLLTVFSGSRAPLQRQLEDLEQERQALKQQLEIIRKFLQMYTGEPLGLSIFDMLAVFMALFSIDLPDLYGLMNAGARDRLRRSRGRRRRRRVGKPPALSRAASLAQPVTFSGVQRAFQLVWLLV